MQQSGGTGNDGMEKDSVLWAGIDRTIESLHNNTSYLLYATVMLTIRH
jgi:hypothetical protein